MALSAEPRASNGFRLALERTLTDMVAAERARADCRSNPACH
jgi:hypothetical protein